MDKTGRPSQSHCECMNCYLYGCPGDNSVRCAKGEKIDNQWIEYYKRKRFENELRIKREIVEKSSEELKAKEIEKKKDIMVREGREKEKIAYDFWYYTLLFILSYEFLKKLIMYNLSTIY